MADLRVDDETLAQVRTRLQSAVNRLEPLLRGIKSFDAGVVGADAMVTSLEKSHGVLATEMEIMGQCVAELAGKIGDVGVTFHQVDAGLASSVR